MEGIVFQGWARSGTVQAELALHIVKHSGYTRGEMYLLFTKLPCTVFVHNLFIKQLKRQATATFLANTALEKQQQDEATPHCLISKFLVSNFLFLFSPSPLLSLHRLDMLHSSRKSTANV